MRGANGISKAPGANGIGGRGIDSNSPGISRSMAGPHPASLPNDTGSVMSNMSTIGIRKDPNMEFF